MVALKPTILLLLAFGGEAIATITPVVCATQLGTASIASDKVPRATTTVKTQVTVVKRIIRKVNVVVVPRPRTTTETETVKTTITVDADPDVETATDIVTDEQTERLTQYTTITSTSTSFTTTTKVTTSTIPAPAGFTPLGQTAQQPGKLKARAANEIPALPEARVVGQYAQRVDCTKKIPSTSIKTVTSTVQGPRKTLQPKTKTNVITTTETITETNYPPKVTETETKTVSPTVTEYETVTLGATATETVTVESVIPAAEPFYAACAASNIVGLQVSQNLGVATSYDTYTGAATFGSYKCCVECSKKRWCFASVSSTDGATCLQYKSSATRNVCPNGQIPWATYYPLTNPDWQWANGPCGYLQNGANEVD
ncbi:hypothetical protein ACHAPJ_008393 [Fusarium lateritium]